ncbi:24891_t:CDS:2 [Gigaspora rosea]|nr:24891_t:CDS:2 [Gigaspora rosea]
MVDELTHDNTNYMSGEFGGAITLLNEISGSNLFQILLLQKALLANLLYLV